MFCPRDIITRDSIHNALTVDMAWAAAPIRFYILPPLLMKPGSNFPYRPINEISEHTPYICKLSPAGEHHIEDLDRAGGIPA